MMLNILWEDGVKSQKKIDVITKRRDAIKIGAKKKIVEIWGGRKKFRRHLGGAEIFLFFFGNQFLMNGIHSQGT